MTEMDPLRAILRMEGSALRPAHLDEAALQPFAVAPRELERPLRNDDLAYVAELLGELGVLFACGLRSGHAPAKLS